MSNRIREIGELGQAIWLDYISRDLLDSGELRQLVNEGIRGVTSNPTIFQKAVARSSLYDDQIRELARDGRDAQQIYEAIAVRDVAEAADVLRSVYDETNARDGFVSLEVDPRLAHDTDATVTEARRLHAAVDRPNLMIKVPATPAGIPAIRTLIAEGVNVNVTLIFSTEVYDQVMRAYIAGLCDRREAARPLARIGSVASFFVSRVDTLVDQLLQDRIERGEPGLGSLLGQAAIANAKIAYDAFKRVFGGDEFAALRAAGARVQRPLWASTSTKNPSYPATKYVDTLIGPDTVNTAPPQTIEAIRTLSMPARSIDMDVNQAYAVVEKLKTKGIQMADVTAQLQRDGVAAFAQSFEQLLADIETKRAALAAR